jgi:hypothetical protein
MLFTELHLFRVQRLGQLIADGWRPNRCRCYRTRPR